jgi:smad nuclear-interacting protein 1
MRRITLSNTKDPKVAQEQPNWGIQALYNDRQLILKKKMTKYFIPYDSALSDGSWRLFFFGDGDSEQTIILDEESTIIGRESFCSVPVSHPSVSRQHAVIQFRRVRLDPHDPTPIIVPYLFDLSSRRGTFLNGDPIPSCCFVQLNPTDRLTFGSSVSAVLMRTSSQSLSPPPSPRHQ